MRAQILGLIVLCGATTWARAEPGQSIALPSPNLDGDVSLEKAIHTRRSRRRFAKRDLSARQIAQLLWAAQGITDEKKGFRSAPSAGARYPMTVYLLRRDGLFRYLPRGHALQPLLSEDWRERVWKDVYARPWLKDAPAIFLLTADYSVTRKKYGRKAERFVHIEAGHIGQNLLLQATALGLHCVGIGAFHDKRVHRTLGLPSNQTVLYLVVVGHPAGA
jgi:SagB-type dehydrogenase family enzyme